MCGGRTIVDQIFFSHSSRDRLIIENVKKKFSEKGIESYFAFDEHEGMPPILKIQNAISKSPAMFVLVTENVLNNRHTRDWVSYEVGFAKGLENCEKREKRVFAWIINVDSKEDELAYLKCITDYQEVTIKHFKLDNSDQDLYVFDKGDIEKLVEQITEKASEIIEITEVEPDSSEITGEEVQTTIIRPNFEITQLIPGGMRRTFPDVGFNIENPNNIPIQAKVLAQVFLGENFVSTLEEHYNGERVWNLNPLTIVGGHFLIPEAAAESDQSLEVKVKVTYKVPDGVEQELLPIGYVYRREFNDWYYNP